MKPTAHWSGARPARWLALAAMLCLARTAPAFIPPPPTAAPTYAADSVAAESALAALARGQFPEAYLTLARLGATDRATGPAPARGAAARLAWSARLAQTRLLIRLGAWNAAQTVLPNRPPTPRGATANAAWPEAAWELTHAELERAAGRPQAALLAARRAAHLLTRLTPPAHPLRAHGWLEVALAHGVGHQLDSALFYAERARTLLGPENRGLPAGWATGLAPRLAFPARPALQLYTLLGLVLNQQERQGRPGPVRIGSRWFASLPAATSAFLDSAVRLSRRADAAQLSNLWRVRGLNGAARALIADDEATAQATARRADADLARAIQLARTPADRATIETSRAELASSFDGPEAALPIFQRALTHLLGERTPTDPSTTDSVALLATFGAAAEQDALLYLLEQQAATYRDLYAATADPRDLDRFFGSATRLAEVLAYRREQARRGIATEPAGRDAATVTDNYALAVEAAEARFRQRGQPADLALAFRITQNAKAWRLHTRVGGARATARLLADEHLLGRYQRATAALRRWEELAALLGAYPALRAAPEMASAPDSVRAARQALATLTAGLQRRHPVLYARALSGSYALPLAQARASLPRNGRTAAVELLRRTSTEDGLHRESLYAFVVQPTGTRLLRLTLPPNFTGLVDSLTEALARPGSAAYPRLAARAYALVLDSVARVLRPEVRHLVVSPDGELWRLPFEALLTRPLTPAEARSLDYRRLPYALRRWSFTYAHSLTLRARARGGGAPAKAARVLGLAPFGDPSTAQALPFSGQLLEQLAATVGGEFLSGTEASRAALRRGAARADVLHLATHATADLADPAASALALADGPVPLAELFSLPLHPRLVVLSACQTGVGRIGGPSESATSLSWGFTYAGAGSTLATLWRVDDKMTAAVLGSFYRHLRGHAAKNVALHRAKLAALDSARTPTTADPFYWAGLVLTGDERALRLAPAAMPARRTRRGTGFAGALAGAALLGAGAWWLRRRRRKAG